jgi:hypothetical protein
MRVPLCIVICALMMVWSVRSANAGSLALTLASSAQGGVQGGIVEFTGTLTNTAATNVFLNGALGIISSSDLTVDNQPFFLNTPLSLPPGGSFTGNLFNVDIGLHAALNTFQGSFTIQGGADANAFDMLASAPFSVTVAATQGFGYYTVTPCRLLDTRSNGPAWVSGTVRVVQVTGMCGIPSNAVAVSLNITAVLPSAAGYITLLPGNGILPPTSTINFAGGSVRANNAVMELASDASGTLAGLVSLVSSGQVDVVLDVNGFFR